MTAKDAIKKAVKRLSWYNMFCSILALAVVFSALYYNVHKPTTGPLDPSIKAIRFADDYAVILTDKPCKDGSQWKQAIIAKQPMSQASISYGGCYYTNAAGQTKMLWNLADPDPTLSQSLPTNLNPL